MGRFALTGIRGAAGALTDVGMRARKVPLGRSLLVAGAALAILLGAVLHQWVAARGPSAAAVGAQTRGFTREQSISGLPLAAQGPVSTALGAANGAFRAHPSGAGFTAVDPGENLSSRFSSAGVAVRSGASELTLALDGVGVGTSLAPVARVAPRARANRVLYRYRGLDAWYANGPLGLEQGFTIAQPPRARGTGPLTLSIAYAGDVQASADGATSSVTFRHAGANPLRYRGLSATDARGHALRSWLELAKGRILLHVDASGASYPVRIDPFLQSAELTESGASKEDRFGVSVALSGDGSTALIGSSRYNGEAGGVWVFQLSGETWTQQATLSGGGEVGKGRFGSSVALSEDGNTALIGGGRDNGETGAAWVFTRSGATWTQQGSKLTGAGESGKGRFGGSVALSSEGETALIGGEGDSSYQGAAWVFTRSGSTWTQQGSKLTAEGESGEGSFGASVALSANGETALIGGASDAKYHGAAWVFTRSAETWTQQGSKLTGAGEEKIGEFGDSVALSSDGNTALIGGQGDNGEVGAAWVFTRSSESWSEQGAKLTARASEAKENGKAGFGASVSLSGDGNTALIGGPNAESGVGAAWVFTRSGTTWSQQGAKLTAGAPGEEGEFGRSVALSRDDSTALIGAPFDASGAGAAWTFTNGPPRPLVVTEPASAVTEGSATLNATVNPDGEEVSQCQFEYGTTIPYESSMPCSSPPGSGTSPVAVSASVAGLSAGTTYHFRISATNASGTSKGSDETFTTEAGQPPTISKLSPKKGAAIGGYTVTITGTNFVAPAIVRFGSVEASSVKVNGQTSITATAPPDTAGPVTVTVHTPGGTSSGGKATFKYGNPTVTKLSPNSGPQAGGTSVTIEGSGFATGAATKFSFGKAAATSVNCASSTECTATAPALEHAKSLEVEVTAVVGKAKSKKTPPGDRYTYE